MSVLLSVVATGLIVALGLWLFASIALRAGGALLAVGGLLATAATGSVATAAAAVLGALAWLAGQWAYAVRHHYYPSPLARRIFNQALPRTLNVARRWGFRVLPVDQASRKAPR